MSEWEDRKSTPEEIAEVTRSYKDLDLSIDEKFVEMERMNRIIRADIDQVLTKIDKIYDTFRRKMNVSI